MAVGTEQDVTQFVRKNVAEDNRLGVQPAAGSPMLLGYQLGNSMVENADHRSKPAISGRNGIAEYVSLDGHADCHIRRQNSHQEVGRRDDFFATRVFCLSWG